MGVLAIRGTNSECYKSLKIELQNQYNLGNNQYPETLTAVARILQNYVGTKGASIKSKVVFEDEKKDGVNLLESEVKPIKGTDGRVHPNISCHHYGKKGHYKSHCPSLEAEEEEEGNEATQLLHVNNDTYLTDDSDTSSEGYSVSLFQAYCLMSKIKRSIPWYWIVLDTGSSDSIFKTKSLLRNVIKTQEKLRLITNAGSIVSRAKGNFEDLSVWYNSDSIANILGLSHVAKTHRIVMDTLQDKAIYAEMNDGKWMRFKQEKMGLFVYDIREGLVEYNFKSNKLSFQLYSLLQTVSQMKEHFTSEELKLADKAKNLCKRLGALPLRKFSL